MTSSNVGVFSFGRKSSERCPNKMLRPFGGTTLADILLQKLRILGDQAFFAAYEPEFREKCETHGVRHVERTLRSVSVDEPITEILSFLRDVPFSHLLIVNGCLPFLRVETIRGFLEECERGGLAPAFGVVRRQNHFIGLDRRPLNFPLNMETINSKTVQPVIEFAHALYFFERSYSFEHGRYWDWRTVRLIEMAGRDELIDIDTEEDFSFAEALWKGRRAHPHGDYR